MSKLKYTTPHCRSCSHICLDINQWPLHQNIVWWWPRQYCKHCTRHQPPLHIHYCVRWQQPIAATCPMVGCLLGAGTASLRRGETGSWLHTTDTDECGNRAAVCYIMTVCYIISWGHIGHHPGEPQPVAGWGWGGQGGERGAQPPLPGHQAALGGQNVSVVSMVSSGQWTASSAIETECSVLSGYCENWTTDARSGGGLQRISEQPRMIIRVVQMRCEV